VKEVRYKHFIAAAKSIYSTEGGVAFTKGVLPRMGINVPSTALSWGTYEIMKSFLIGKQQE
jgi:Mitochondrial carrier protein